MASWPGIELEAWAEAASAIGARGGGEGSLGGEEFGVPEEDGLGAEESVEVFLVTKIGFFRVGGPGSNGGCCVLVIGRVLVSRKGFFRVGALAPGRVVRVLVSGIAFFRVGRHGLAPGEDCAGGRGAGVGQLEDSGDLGVVAVEVFGHGGPRVCRVLPAFQQAHFSRRHRATR